MVTNDLSQDQRMHRICETLTTAGFDVQLVGRQRKDSIALTGYSFDTKRMKCFFTSGFLFYAEYNFRLLLYLLFQHVDIINSVDLDTLIAGRLSSAVKRKQFTFDAHELFTEVPELNGRPFRRWLWSVVQKLFVKGRMDCYTVNDHLAAKLSEQTNKDFRVIYNYPRLGFVGGEANKNRNGDANKNFGHSNKNHGDSNKSLTQKTEIHTPIQLVYQGMLNQGRGLLEAIDSVGSNIKYELHIIGKGDIEKQIKRQCEAHANIHLHGFVDPSKLREKTKQFDIGLNLLSDTSDNYIYSSANKFFDYLMAGLPVISMDFPEYKKVNDKYEIGVLIKDLQTENIIGAIESIHRRYGVYSENCSKALRELNWESQKAVLLKIYGSPKAET